MWIVRLALRRPYTFVVAAMLVAEASRLELRESYVDLQLCQAGPLRDVRTRCRPEGAEIPPDEMARGAYEALYERGLRVPDDLSVVGFDDLEQARWSIPPLTTVRQPLSEMASLATRMLLTLAAGGRLDASRLELATPLIVRNSTAAPACSRSGRCWRRR